MSGSHLSKDFFELVKSIGESKSKQEEDRIIIHEVANLKRRMNETNNNNNTVTAGQNKKKQKEFLIRLMYVEMLGHDASFGYIKAVELTASTNLLQKRVGYLTCSLVLSPTHEFRFMIINQLQRDLQSSNHLEVCSALMAICKLVTIEMIPAVLPMIIDILRHDNEYVRKKAVMALHRFHQLNPESIVDYCDNLRRTLCDKDPSVMGAVLCTLHDLGLNNPIDYKDLVPSYVSILKQITEHRLPREYDYHRIPAPWIQIRLLRILSILGQADQATSEGMYEVLHDVMRRADTGINVGYAIIYECVKTITTIYPNSTLLDAAAASISRFISSDNHNLKYLGVTGLAAIVKDHPKYAAAHQMAVIDCLEDPDETLKRKTLDLLYRMTNPVNVEFITQKLTQFLRDTTDIFLRKELVNRITQCAERYAPSNGWYIQTMTNVFELGGDLVKEEVAHNLLHLIAEGSDENEEEDEELRHDAVEIYLELLTNQEASNFPNANRKTIYFPDILVRVMAWILGEYGYLSSNHSLEDISDKLCDLIERPFLTSENTTITKNLLNQSEIEDLTKAYIITALMKICARLNGRTSDKVLNVIKKYKSTNSFRSTELQQRCSEFLLLANKYPNLMATFLPQDAFSEDIEVDINLEFLNNYVDNALRNNDNLIRYCPPPMDDSDDEDYHLNKNNNNNNNGLNFQAYKKPELPYLGTKLPANTYDVSHSNLNMMPTVSTQQVPVINNDTVGYSDPYGITKVPGVKNVWGPSGLRSNENNPPNNMNQIVPPQQAYMNNYPPPPVAAVPSYPAPTPIPPEMSYNPRTEYKNNSYQNDPISSSNEIAPDERQLMASALFGGVPGAAPVMVKKTPSKNNIIQSTKVMNNNNTNNTRRPIKKKTGSQIQAPKEIDLLDINFDTSSATTSNHTFDQTNSNTNNYSTATNYNGNTYPEDPFGMSSLQANIPNSSVSTNNVFSFNGNYLQPYVITTQEFGQRWGTCHFENKIKIHPTNSKNSTLDQYIDDIKLYSIHPVEAIKQTNEVIAASLCGDNTCLIHTKIRSAGFLEMTIKTMDLSLTNELSHFLENVLK